MGREYSINILALITTHVICENLFLNAKDGDKLFAIKPPCLLWQKKMCLLCKINLCFTSFKTLHKRSFLIVDFLLQFCPNDNIKIST